MDAHDYKYIDDDADLAYEVKPVAQFVAKHSDGGVVAVIPARGGSKGIPHKAVKKLGKWPTIGWTIEAAKAAGCVDRVFVSTEDAEIADVAGRFGVEVLNRPVCLAQDDSQTDEVYTYCLRQMRHELHLFPETLVLLQPASPFRTASQIDEAFELYTPAETVISCCVDTKFHWAIDEEEDYEAVPIFHSPMHRQGRQAIDDRDRLLAENGAIYIVDAERLSQERCCRVPPFSLYLMDALHSVDLDTMDDWDYATWLVETGRIHV